MCLSTVYKNELRPENIAMQNVMTIECQDDMVILTDLLERQVAIRGTLIMANLVEGKALVRELADYANRNASEQPETGCSDFFWGGY